VVVFRFFKNHSARLPFSARLSTNVDAEGEIQTFKNITFSSWCSELASKTSLLRVQEEWVGAFYSRSFLSGLRLEMWELKAEYEVGNYILSGYSDKLHIEWLLRQITYRVATQTNHILSGYSDKSHIEWLLRQITYWVVTQTNHILSGYSDKSTG
jgi:hypothetical protein